MTLTSLPWRSMYKTDLKKREWLVFEIIAEERNQETYIFLMDNIWEK